MVLGLLLRGNRKNKELQLLKNEVERLKIQNQQLQEQLAASTVVVGEYLYRYRTFRSFLASEWELCYVVLNGTSIKYYKSAKDLVYNPREEISVMGCAVEWEGLKNGRHWTFSIVDPSGSVLLRLSALNQAVAEKWVDALVSAGCPSRNTLHRRSWDGNERAAAAGAASQAQHVHGAPSPIQVKGPVRRSNSMPEEAHRALSPAGAAPQAQQQQPQESAAAASGGVTGPEQSTPRRGREVHAHRLSNTGLAEASGAGGEGAGGASDVAPAGAAGAEASAPVDAAAIHQHHQQQPAAAAPADGAAAAAAPRTHQPMLGSSPVHSHVQYSYLSSERMWHEKHSGLWNLMAIILVATNFRLALENALKYGWRCNPLRSLRDLTISNPNIPLALCYPVMALIALVALCSELVAHALLTHELKLQERLIKRGDVDAKAASRALKRRQAVHEWALFAVNTLNTSAAIGVPWYIIYRTQAEPIAGGILIMLAITLWMKLISYHHCCADLRTARRAGEVRPGERGSPNSPAEWSVLKYPENLTVSNLAYFLAAPTLCYQVNYPLSGAIRWRWLARRVCELVMGLTVLGIIIKQYVEPSVANSMRPLQQMDMLHLSERVLKLALPSLYSWLVMFYCLFHLWLNILAELLRFGDRVFYKDFWNAATVGEYWRLWNMPVHKWLLRHVYFPSMRLGLSRFWAMVLVFFVSAVFHELVLGVPLHMVRLWAFSGIMLQVPLAMATETIRKRVRRDDMGNYVFWLSFCFVGQPVSVLLYYHDFMYTVRPQLLGATGQGPL